MILRRVIVPVGGPLGPKRHPLNIRRPRAASYGIFNKLLTR